MQSGASHYDRDRLPTTSPRERIHTGTRMVLSSKVQIHPYLPRSPLPVPTKKAFSCPGANLLLRPRPLRPRQTRRTAIHCTHSFRPSHRLSSISPSFCCIKHSDVLLPALKHYLSSRRRPRAHLEQHLVHRHRCRRRAPCKKGPLRRRPHRRILRRQSAARLVRLNGSASWAAWATIAIAKKLEHRLHAKLQQST